MTVDLASATAMASRRRRRSTGRPKEPPPDLGTPETRARLVPPPWRAWGPEIEAAAIQIETAVRLRAGAMHAKAQQLGRIGGEGNGDWSAAERAIVRRYLGWCTQMRAIGWSVADVIGCVAAGEPAGDEWQLRAALTLYATGKILRAS